LHEALFVERPNRFLLRVRLADGQEPVSVHLPDPGRLRELLRPGVRVWVTPAANPDRKTRWTAVLTETPDGTGVVSLNTTLPNTLIGKALEGSAIEELSAWTLERPEFTVGRSRFDFLLRDSDGQKLLLEVKSVTLVEDGVARFPDAVTARGARHLQELTHWVQEQGQEAAVLFVLQRDDADSIEAAHSIDPHFAEALEAARRAGVRVLGRRCGLDTRRITLGDAVPVR
jgi:sugar fermentation stimulation protein A